MSVRRQLEKASNFMQEARIFEAARALLGKEPESTFKIAGTIYLGRCYDEGQPVWGGPVQIIYVRNDFGKERPDGTRQRRFIINTTVTPAEWLVDLRASLKDGEIIEIELPGDTDALARYKYQPEASVR